MDVGGGGKRSCSRKIAHDLAIYTAPAGSPLYVSAKFQTTLIRVYREVRALRGRHQQPGRTTLFCRLTADSV